LAGLGWAGGVDGMADGRLMEDRLEWKKLKKALGDW